MTTTTVPFIWGLAAFLDANGIEYTSNDKQEITFYNWTDTPVYKVIDRQTNDIVFFGFIEDCKKFQSESDSPIYLTFRRF